MYFAASLVLLVFYAPTRAISSLLGELRQRQLD
jgi:hypothetical protein